MKVREFVALLLEHAPPDADIETESGEYNDGEIDGIDIFAGNKVTIMWSNAAYTSAEQEERRALAAQEAAEEEVRRARERKAALNEKLAGWGLTEADLPEAPK
jgi:hypothetical protein